MKANTLGVYQLFENHRRYVVPLYQRPYVWTRDEQWLPLWNDIRGRAEAVLRAGRDREANKHVHPHFLGAIVTSQVQVFGREVHAYDVIDGQQRLTTLQLFLAAFRDVVAASDATLHKDLIELTRNTRTVANEHERYKVWPTNADRKAFQAVMDAGSREGVQAYVHSELAAYRREPVLAQAYLCFYDQIHDWVQGGNQEEPSPGKSCSERIDAIFDAVKRLLQVVEIALEDGDDPQMIFETLNARGVPLLPSDLVRNYIFTQANRNDEDADALYDRFWRAFEDIDTETFWKAEVTIGRDKRQRIDLFLYHLLTAVLADDISVSHLFSAFKRWWEGQSGPRSAEDGLRVLRGYSAAYRRIVEPDGATRFGVFCERLQVLDVSTLHPVLLHLQVERGLDDSGLDPIVTDLESFLVRRAVCRLTAKNLNRYFLGLLQELRSQPEAPAHKLVRDYLLAGQGDSVRWPGDEEFRNAWLHSPSYRRVRRRNVTMILEAIDRQLRTGYQEGVRIEKPLTVEHVMPQSWQKHWPDPVQASGDETAEARRDRLIHTFGNLTLLTRGLNAKVGNAAFLPRRREITQHTELRLNAYFQGIDSWDEEGILRRGAALFTKALEVWHHPAIKVWDWAESHYESEEEAPDVDTGPRVLAQALDEFSRALPPGTVLHGKARTYRQVRIEGWPRELHYEFNARRDVLEVGLHLELNQEHPLHARVTATLEDLVPVVQQTFPGYEAAVEEKGKHWRWISLPFALDVPAPIIAQAMRDLIHITKESMGELLAGEEGRPTAEQAT